MPSFSGCCLSWFILRNVLKYLYGSLFYFINVLIAFRMVCMIPLTIVRSKLTGLLSLFLKERKESH